MGLRHHLQYLQTTAALQVSRILRLEAIDKTVGLLRMRIGAADNPVCIFNQDQVALGIGLNALMSGAREYAGEVICNRLRDAGRLHRG